MVNLVWAPSTTNGALSWLQSCRAERYVHLKQCKCYTVFVKLRQITQSILPKLGIATQ